MADIAQPDFQRYGRPAEPASADPAIRKALAAIDPSRMEQTIKTLVGFNTRNTLTSMETGLPPGQGIDAAADWIAAQFAQIAQACGGCLEVKRDTFTADPASPEASQGSWAKRIPRPTRITTSTICDRSGAGQTRVRSRAATIPSTPTSS